MTDYQYGDLVTFNRGDAMGTHALVLEVLHAKEQLRVTWGPAHESELVDQECATKLPREGSEALLRRLAFSMTQVPKLLAEKDQWAEERIDVEQKANAALVGKLADIRKWMISTHEDGTLPREDLDSFLEEFGLEAYRKRWTGTITIKVSLSVDDAEDRDLAEAAAYAWAEERIVGESDENVDCPDIIHIAYNLVEDRS